MEVCLLGFPTITLFKRSSVCVCVCVCVCSLSLFSKEVRVSFLSFFTDLNMMILNTVSITAILLTLSGLRALVLTQEKAISVQAGQNVKILCSPSTVFGGGTEVTFARPPSPPSLVLLAPSQASSSGDEVRVVCLAQGFRPDSATLSWSDNGNAVAGAEVQTSSSQRQSDGTFVQSSMLKLSPERWSSGRTYTCHLNHPALSAPLSQSTSADKCS
ncbi:hypothetical protein PHYPO_G00183110 [Pangasianodon hypophthalmus]|uniref:Ig-like domain-containing protein n=1 Tax=Pangasianodon hypophthalmus TaxID=310915 RepID=A0A5N5PSA8_PANHP|nr:hypothetical protein PHYPO_G00183110 [Pangasianodon hypophthalmus]